MINCQLGTASATITFNSGLMVTLETDLDYPQPYTAITVVNVESAVESPQKLGAVKVSNKKGLPGRLTTVE